MPRQDYDEIKKKFADFVRTWKTGDINALDCLALPNVSCRFSAAPHSNDEWDGLEGLKTFVSTYPKTDVLQIAIYNYACNLAGDKAQQSAIVCCESLNYVDEQEEMEGISYSLTYANHWVKTQNGWKLDEVHCDVYHFYWTNESILEQFRKTWYLGSKLVADGNDGRLPAIEGEFDLPWEKYPNCEDVLTEEEKILDSAAKMFTSADYSININRCTTRSDFINTDSTKYGKGDGIRAIVNNKRYKRLKERYWVHPWRTDEIEFNEDKTWAKCRSYRPFGWKQRNHEYVWTRSNLGVEHMCCGGGYAYYVKEDGQWKMADIELIALGIYLVGPFSETLYGDRAV